MAGLSHFDADGQAHMVDVSGKAVTDRMAVASGCVKMSLETLAIISEGRAKKGDVLGVARLAGIMGAKRTADLIPLCHPLPITKVALDLTPDADLPGVRITVRDASSAFPLGGREATTDEWGDFVVEGLPLLGSGKPDRAVLRRRAAALASGR